VWSVSVHVRQERMGDRAEPNADGPGMIADRATNRGGRVACPYA
jgi:hypothetical protein